MFYEQDILEGLTKKTFYDSSRIVLTDLEQSLLEKTSTSLVLFPTFTRTLTRHSSVLLDLCVDLTFLALPSTASFTHQTKDKITEIVESLVREISMMSWLKALKL